MVDAFGLGCPMMDKHKDMEQSATELEKLFESFCHWADNGISAFDLSRFTSFTTAPPANSTTDVPHW
jgi:hypothetical protein